jgi:hypothetical protein
MFGEMMPEAVKIRVKSGYNLATGTILHGHSLPSRRRGKRTGRYALMRYGITVENAGHVITFVITYAPYAILST